MKELREEVEARGLQQTVGLTGFVTEPAAALRGLDVVVHASTMPEPFGLAVAEAMTAGCSVVISDTGGVAELVDPGRTGFSYRSTNVEDMTRRVRQLLDDPGLRHQLSAAAHEAASTQFNPDRVSAQILDLYATVTPERVMAHAS
jgi:glycosyltransferase involved in cell wall biosynthesis